MATTRRTTGTKRTTRESRKAAVREAVQPQGAAQPPVGQAATAGAPAAQVASPPRQEAPVPPTGPADLHDAIARRAYELYEAAGRPEGQAEAHWLQAEAEVLAAAGRSAAARA